MIRKGLQDTSFDLSEFHFAYFFFHTQEDALGGTAGDCTLLADPDYMDVGGADACTMFALSKWTGAAAESLASYPYEQLYTPSSSLAYQDVGHLQNVRYVNGSDTASIKRLILAVRFGIRPALCKPEKILFKVYRCLLLQQQHRNKPSAHDRRLG